MEGAIAKKQSFPLPRPPPGEGGSSHNKAIEGPAASTRGKTTKDKNKSKIVEKVRDLQKQGAEVFKSLKADKTAQDKLQRILDGLTELETMATRQEQACQKDHNENSGKDGRNNDLAAIMKRLTSMEERMAKPTQAQGPAAPGPRTWSQVAARGVQQPARVELRIENMEGADKETPQEQLERVRKAIPEAQAIITHPRSLNKISVVVKDTVRRDQIILNGIQGAEGMKIIRHPRLVMVSGIPLDTPIKNGKCAENDTWIAQVQSQNKNIKIERAGWLYSAKNLASRREAGKQKKGSVILSMSTEEAQHRAIKQGLLVGAEWHPVQMWDISLTDGQCFKCWKWGHNQSVCNAQSEICGHCAGMHSTRDCKTTAESDASCTGCKQKGHKAWMSRSCKAYQAFRDQNERKKRELLQVTMAIQANSESQGRASPTFSFGGSTRVNSPQPESEWQVAGGSNKRQRTESNRVGRPSFLQRAARAPGQTRFPTRTAPAPAPDESTTVVASTAAAERHEDPEETEDTQRQETIASTQ